MRLSLGLSGLLACSVACGAAQEWEDELGVASQALEAPIVETFSGSVARNEAVARGPFAVQPGSQLRVTLSGTGDADLYVRFGSRPTTSTYNCRPYAENSAEQCVLTVPANATTAFIDVRGFTAATYSLQVERVAGGSGGSGGASGSGGSSGSSGSSGSGSGTGTATSETFSGSVARNEAVARGPFAVQPGSQLRVTLSGTGDADLYVRFGSRPTLTSYDCRPYADNSAEQCVLTVPASATSAFIDVRGFTAATYSLQVQRVAGGSGGSGGSSGSAGSGGSGSAGSGGSGGGGTSTEPFVIAVLGSSTAEGEGASSLANSWVGLLETALTGVANVSITNLATGGYTTLELLPGSGAAGNINAAIAEQPDLIVVALAGSNDLSIGTSTATYLSRLTQLRDTARTAGIPTFFVSTAPKDLSDEERLELADWTEQMRGRFNTCWAPANAAFSPCFIDVFAGLANADLEIAPQFDAGDGIHINDAGHRVMFQRAVNIIQPYVCSVSQCR